MSEINTREVRDHLGAILDRVEKGEEIMISRRGKKIARLTPLPLTEHFFPSPEKIGNSFRIKGKEVRTADEDKIKRAFEAVGRFSSDRSDVSVHHDDYLADIYGKIEG